jgi:diaminopimelate epimerase
MKFTKMHGIGNDYVYVDGSRERPSNVEAAARFVSDRHFGIGSDGLILINPSKVADFEMEMYNADGSRGKMCGNGIRCVGKYVYDKGYTDKTHLTIETLSGIRTLDLQIRSGKVKSVTVDMGRTEVAGEIGLTVNGEVLRGIPASVGNPHFVIFVYDMDKVDLYGLGPLLEKHDAFPGGVNVEFVQVIDKDHLRMRGWERGSGVTMACGTGACASTAAAVIKGYCRPDDPVSVELDGGTLEITIKSDGTAMMNGPAALIYEGETEI